jgi:hypothetical protein
MIEQIKHNDKFSYLVSDEPTAEYRDIMLYAAADNKHELHLNYKTDIIKESYFVTIILDGNNPVEIYGLEKTEWPGVARGFYRAYRRADQRGHHLEFSKIVMNFYKWYPQFHIDCGIHTIFVTRNHKGKSNFSGYLRKSDADYYKFAGTHLYRKTLQDFYVWGNPSFLSDIPINDSYE